MATRLFRSGNTGTDTKEIITLWGGAAANNYTTLRKAGQAAGYQVTAGLTFYVTRIMIPIDTNAAAAYAHLLTGTSDVGINSAAAPTGIVNVIGDAATASNTALISVGSAGSPAEYPVAGVSFAAGTYPGARMFARATGILVEGYEA